MGLPTPIRVLVLLVSAGVALSACAGVYVAAFVPPRTAWFTLGFEVSVLVAALFGVLTALGRFRDSPALALLNVAGATAVGSLLGWIAIRGSVDIDLAPALAARGVGAGMIALAAAWAALRPGGTRAVVRLAFSLLWLGVLVAGALGARAAWDSVLQLPDAVRAVIAVAGFLLATGAFSASLHLAISAFAGRPAASDTPTPA